MLIIVVTVAGTVIGSNAIICVVALLLLITTFVFVEVLVLGIVWLLVDKSSTVVYTVIV